MQIFSPNMLREIGVSQAKHVLTQNNYSTRCRSLFFHKKTQALFFHSSVASQTASAPFIYSTTAAHLFTQRTPSRKKKKICINNVTLNFRIVETTYVKVADIDIYIFFSFSRQEIISVPQNPIVGTPLRQSAHGHEAHNKKMLMH